MLRPYTPADRTDCLAILESNTPRYFTQDDHTDYLAFLDNIKGTYSVFEDDAGRIIGCGGAATLCSGLVGCLTWGMIHVTRHRQGWGTLLTLARLHELSQIATVQKIGINTSNETAGFYTKLGFHTAEVMPNYYAPGLDRYVMTLKVDDAFRQHLATMMER